MRFYNAVVFTPEGFRRGGFAVENGRFTEVFSGDGAGDVDLGGAWVIPGLVDIHVHGALGEDFSDGDIAGLGRIAAYLASRGVTAFAPTSATVPYDALEKAFAAAAELQARRPAGCARIAGVHMEGPFLSEKRKGSQNGAYLQKPDFNAFSRLYEGCGGLVRIVDVAPELPGAEAFTREVSKFCTVSVAHTDADYEQARAVFEAGATHLTHTFNAMPPIHHRAPGVIGAAAERQDVAAELICDGLHVHPSAVRMAFRLFPGRVCLISDTLRCCGMPDGEYSLGGQPIFLSGGVAQLADGTLAGAASDLYDDLRRAVDFGIPIEDAVRAATETPAREVGRADEMGAIAPGLWADFVVCGGDLERRAVCMGGERVEPASCFC